MPYVDYAFENGIIDTKKPDESYKIPASRYDFAQVIANALPDTALPEINDISDGAIPDVTNSGAAPAAVYKLYRAGILTGSDEFGTFNPWSGITRAETAAIVSRMADPALRKLITLG